MSLHFRFPSQLSTTGRPVVGVVVDVSTARNMVGRRLVAAPGATGLPCHVASGRSVLATALVATGFSYNAERRAEQAAVLLHLLPAVRDIRRFGSAALDLCWVAGGRFDAFYESGLNVWDWAAGSLICEEAGGEVTMLPGNVLLATTPELTGPLVDLLAEAQNAPGAGLRGTLQAGNVHSDNRHRERL